MVAERLIENIKRFSESIEAFCQCTTYQYEISSGVYHLCQFRGFTLLQEYSKADLDLNTGYKINRCVQSRLALVVFRPCGSAVINIIFSLRLFYAAT